MRCSSAFFGLGTLLFVVGGCAAGASNQAEPGGKPDAGSQDAAADTPQQDGGTLDGDGSTPPLDGASGEGGLNELLELCVLNAAGPTGSCSPVAELAFGTIAAGATEMRMFRIDNKGLTPIHVQSLELEGTGATIVTVRYEVDPGNSSNMLRVTQSLPYVIAAEKALYAEVTIVGAQTSGDLAAKSVRAVYNFAGKPAQELSVPIVGKSSGCPAGKANCSGDPATGCETDILTSMEHCGACGAPCQPSQGQGQCQQGACTLVSCTAPFADCDLNAANGCEVNLLNTVEACGDCATNCLRDNTDSFCNGGNCNIIGCHPGWADCDLDALTGCETDINTSMGHCGGCNLLCDPAHATESCAAGICKLVACIDPYADCDTDPKNGCEIDLDTDVFNCSACGKPCFFANASATCQAAQCALGTCAPDFANCNGFESDGCEVDLQNNPSNCGACGNDCSLVYPGATVACTSGACVLSSCAPGFYDIDGDPKNGCEYACTFLSATDVPDDGNADDNCDGIDGDVGKAIFVSTTGSDANPGTKQQPMRTVTAGIGKAFSTGKDQVYVSEGIYAERVALANGISVHGGYSQSNAWKRSASFISTIRSSVVSSGALVAVEGANLTSALTVDRLEIETTSTVAAGVSNYAFHCVNCPAVTLKGSWLTAGGAGPGQAGTVGTAGGKGYPGGNGGPGSCDGAGTRTGGAFGTSDCVAVGGRGGWGGSEGANKGENGLTGTGGTPGGPGGNGGSTGQAGSPGGAGANGAAGLNGASGNGGLVSASFWVSATGGNGAVGVHGKGGGGGGGGGGQGGLWVDDGAGNGGGGGGGAGCGGGAGTGGKGGGGSFGLFLVNSTGFIMLNNTIVSGHGGKGGDGGSGGSGGLGAVGGLGWTTCTGEVGAGGNGGKGGDGGRGGHGAGGAGGPSYAVFRSNTTVAQIGNTLTPGTPGTGGASLGNAGVTGASAAIN